MRPLIIVLASLPLVALAQTSAPAPPPVLSPQESTAELAKLHGQVTTLQSQLQEQGANVQSLEQQLAEAEQRAQAFRAQVTQLQDRGSTNEQARVERLRTMDGVKSESANVDYLMSLGSDDLDAYLASLQSTLEGVQQSAGATSGRHEFEADSYAVQSIQLAREALADGDYFHARGYLSDALIYGQAAETAAGTNSMREWTGQ